jgi:peptidoglycan-associated lipoprotein
MQWIAVAAVASLALFVSACGPKKSKSPADINANTVPATPSRPAEDINAKPKPSLNDSTANDPLRDPDLAKLNDYIWKQGLLGDVYFDFDKADLTDAARERLARNGEFLRTHPEYEVTVEGHCDERGTNEYNLALGDRRASAARDYMGSLGLNAARLRTISYGEERPLCSVSAESCWSQNRRAHFVVTARANVG